MILFIGHIIYDIMVIWKKGGTLVNLMEKTYKFDIATCLKQLNREYHQSYTLEDLAKKMNATCEALSQLSTDSKFSIVYTTAEEIFNFYPEMTSDRNFSFREVLMRMCDSDYFYIP